MNQDINAHSSSTVVDPAENEIVVNSVAEFIAQLAQIDMEEGIETFYRGHADREWKLLPSLLRTPNGADKEHLIFRDMVSHEPLSFSECRSALDHLVQMQHYGLPTRLLDVTMNPLVALYFACGPGQTETLEGVLNAGYEAGISAAAEAVSSSKTDVENDSIASYSRSSFNWIDLLSSFFITYPLVTFVAIHLGSLAAVVAAAKGKVSLDGFLKLSKDHFMNVTEVREVKKVVELAAAAGAQAVVKPGLVYLFSVPENKVKHYDSDTVSVLANLAKCQITEDCLALSSGEGFNQQASIKELIYQIQGEKPHFSPLIKEEDLRSLLFVKPRNGNQRIINQMGAFLLFGLGLKQAKGNDGVEGGASLSKEVHLEVPNEWIKRKFIIPSDKKDAIRKELANLGITDSYIYPGIEQYAKDLKLRYRL